MVGRLLVLLLFMIPAAHAALDDPQGDHEAGYYPQHWEDEPVVWLEADDHGWYPFADVLRIGLVDETPEELVFEVEVAGLEPSGDEPSEFRYGAYRIPFRFHGEDHAVEFRYDLEDGDAHVIEGRMETYSFGDRDYTYLRPSWFGQAQPLEEGTGWRGVVPKIELRDIQEVPARSGDVLEDLQGQVTAERSYRVAPCVTNDPQNCWKVRDLVEGSEDYEITQDAPGVGHLLLQSDAPFRGSNGAATTYLFNLTLRNLDAIEDRVTIQTGGHPSDWTVRAPATLELPPEETVSIPIAVSVPFRHTHGEMESMEVRVASTADPSVEAVQRLAVIWHDVPQPGGHHPTLFLHAHDQGSQWMNTLPEDADATGAEAETNSYSASHSLTRSSYDLRYGFYLRPGLSMGLDFVPDDPMRVDFDMTTEEDLEGTLSVRLVLQGRESPEVLAQASQDVTWAAGANPVEWDVPLTDDVDRIPFEAGRALRFEVELEYARDRQVVGDPLEERSGLPRVVTDGATIDLPLQEYHDIIDQDLLSRLARLSLRADGDVTKAVNPGKTAVFTFAASNSGDESTTVDWHLEGPNAAWGEVVPTASTVRPGQNATVIVAVDVPADAADGDEAPLLLIGQDRSDADRQVFGRLLATVTTTEEIPDEADALAALADDAQRHAAKESPAPAWSLMALALLVLMRRRT